jgi:hypothetical protein
MRRFTRLLIPILLIFASLSAFAAVPLTVTFQTSESGGKYRPDNVVVVWITTEPGDQFVRTIGRWAGSQRDELNEWVTESGGNDTDAVSGATRDNHNGSLTATWDLTNRSDVLVPNGTYRINFLSTDSNSSSQSNRATFTFNNDGVPSSQGPTSLDGFLNVSIAYTGLPATPTPTPTATPLIPKQLSLSSELGSPGGVASLDATMVGAKNETVLGFDVVYDASLLTFTGLTHNTAFIDPWFIFAPTEDTSGTIHINGRLFDIPGQSPQPINGDGKLLDLHFAVVPNAPLGVIDITLANPTGGMVGALLNDGQITVEQANTPTHTPVPTYTPTLTPTPLPFAPAAVFVGGLGGRSLAIGLCDAGVCLGQSAQLTMIDATDPSQPKALGSVRFPDVIRDIATSDNRAYVALGAAGIGIVDVSSSGKLQPAGLFDTPGHSAGAAFSDPYLLVADGPGGLLIIDVSNPAAPNTVGVFTSQGPICDVVAVGSTAYALDEYNGLQVVDFSLPASPALIGSLTAEYGESLALSGVMVYIADRYSGLSIVNVSNPALPALIEEATLTVGAHDLAISGSYILAAAGGLGVESVNISSTDTRGMFGTPGDARALVVSGTIAYVADGRGGMHIMDVSDPLSPQGLGSFAMLSEPLDVVLQGAKAYVADNINGRQAIDLRNLSALQASSDSVSTEWGRSIALNGAFAYVADGTGGVQIFEVSATTYPVLQNTFPTTGIVHAIAVEGERALIADGSSVQLLDVSAASSPVSLGFWSSSGFAFDVALSNGWGYVADGGHGLQVLDISIPHNITTAGGLDTPGVAYGVVVSGSTAFVADGPGGLQIIDVSSPTSPAPLGNHPTLGSANGVVASATRVFVADGLAGLQVFDVSDPAAPTRILTSDLPVQARNVATMGNLVYMADDLGGLLILNTEVGNETDFSRLLGFSQYWLNPTDAGNANYNANGDNEINAADLLLLMQEWK